MPMSEYKDPVMIYVKNIIVLNAYDKTVFG
jgi:hypothetical protein